MSREGANVVEGATKGRRWTDMDQPHEFLESDNV